jgi:hypothetical protein
MKCTICGGQNKLTEYHNACPGLCTYAMSHYSVLFPGGTVRLSKSMEHITKVYNGYAEKLKKKLTH